MGRVLTNKSSIAYSVEASLGVLAGSPIWKLLEPNSINTFGATITTVAREPISKLRDRRKGTVTDLESAVEFDADLTKEHFKDFVEGLLFAKFRHPSFGGGAAQQSPIRSGAPPFGNNLAADNDPPPAGTDAGYTHDALAQPIATDTLVFARGFAVNPGNNGLKRVLAGSTTTATLVAGTLIDETPGNVANATLEIAGRQFPTSDLGIVVTGTTAVLTTAAGNFTNLGLNVGQYIHIGGLTSANWFSSTNRGYARIRAITTTTLSLDKLDATLATDTGASDTIQLLFGAFVRNVPVDNTDFIERSYQFELALRNLQVPGPGDEFEYAKGNEIIEIAFNIPITDKATFSAAFVGTDTPVPTTVQATNAATPLNPVETTAFNTTSDTFRLRVQKVDETGITTCFKNADLTIANNVNAEKCLGTLGATFLNFGFFFVNLEAVILLTDSRVIAAIRNNETVTMDFILRNDNGAIAGDIPSLTLGDGSKEFPVNESVNINLSGQAFIDASLGYSVAFSLFPAVPLA